MKIVYLEFLRVICAIVVIIDHICIAGIHIWGEKATEFEKFFYNGVQHWSHFAVPVFLMISGYLLLDPCRDVGYKKAIKKYAWRMIVILLIIGSVFSWMELYFETRSFSLKYIIVAISNTIKGDTWKHLWYLYTLIGLYLVLPFVKAVWDRLNYKEMNVFLLLLFLFSSVIPVISVLSGYKIGIAFPITSIYLFYFLIGRKIGTMQQHKVFNKWLITLVFCLLSLFTFTCSYLEYYRGMTMLEKLSLYSSPVIVVLGASLFYLGRYLDSKLSFIYNRGGNVINHLSLNSFGIYIFHMLWINVLYKVIRFNPLDYGIWILIPLTILIFIASDITTSIFRRIPYIGKYI